MFSNTFSEVLEILRLLTWLLNIVFVGLLLVTLGSLAWLCYTEARSHRGNRR